MPDPEHTENSHQRERRLARYFWIAYALSWIVALANPAIGAVAFVLTGAVFWAGIARSAVSAGTSKPQMIFVMAVLIGPALGACWTSYNNKAESRNFRAYLDQHRCKYQGEIVVGFSKGGCDRAGNCEDPAEIEESEYFCASTNRRITFSQFREGSYGQ